MQAVLKASACIILIVNPKAVLKATVSIIVIVNPQSEDHDSWQALVRRGHTVGGRYPLMETTVQPAHI